MREREGLSEGKRFVISERRDKRTKSKIKPGDLGPDLAASLSVVCLCRGREGLSEKRGWSDSPVFKSAARNSEF